MSGKEIFQIMTRKVVKLSYLLGDKKWWKIARGNQMEWLMDKNSVPLRTCPNMKQSNLFPGSLLSTPRKRERDPETVAGAGHVSPRIWEITNK